MRLEWTDEARQDLERLHSFLVWKSPAAAARAINLITLAPARLLAQPMSGERIESMLDQGSRRVLAGPYELRYDVADDVVRILRIFHTREVR